MTSKRAPAPILSPGRNCWRIERAEKLTLVIDAEAYFAAVKEAVLQARHCVYLIGWDFDTRIRFEPEHQTLEGPNKLGPFLRWIDKNRPGGGYSRPGQGHHAAGRAELGYERPHPLQA
jgi:phospholipase D1/2